MDIDNLNVIYPTPDYVLGFREGHSVLVPIGVSLTGGGQVTPVGLVVATLSSGQANWNLNTNGIPGTTTNGNAAAGTVGEFVTSTIPVGSAVALTTATTANVTSISLTPGDWDVNGVVDYNLTGATVSQVSNGPSLTTNTLPTQAGGSGLGTDALATDQTGLTTVTGVQSEGGNDVRVSIAATTTVYLVANAVFSAGTVAAFGTIRARRVR